MLSYDEALERVLSAAVPLPPEEVPLAEARGRAVSQDVFAPLALPSFDNSAVDGFAVRALDTTGASPQTPVRLMVGETISAGQAPTKALALGTASRIFTGAPLPAGADALVMVEDTESSGSEVSLYAPGSARFLRRRGSDLQSGALALAAGSEIDAGSVGLLAALGKATVSCRRSPRVAILTTGDELRDPQEDGNLPPGAIFNSNAPALAASVQEAGGIVSLRRHLPDDPEAIRDALAEASRFEVVLTSGGVSVGDRDFVKGAVGALGRLDFWRIAIKPGKPLAFGRVGDALFFGLPGNPVSSLVTFELFVRPVLRRFAGHSRVLRTVVSATLAKPLPHEPGRREFVRARIGAGASDHGGSGALIAVPLGIQDSHRLSSLALAELLLIAHEDHGDYAAGETLPALLL
ncbi:MAG: molybdopterin molybdotransferase MoeA [Cytophagales bacterium]|nr:molybdopterin molybdotransferase MoeA [Armatimonadota bacterium]